MLVAPLQSTVCGPLKVVENWQKLLVRQFGEIAPEIPAPARVVEYLTSRAGSKKAMAV